jgi:hypothetical protein
MTGGQQGVPLRWMRRPAQMDAASKIDSETVVTVRRVLTDFDDHQNGKWNGRKVVAAKTQMPVGQP